MHLKCNFLADFSESVSPRNYSTIQRNPGDIYMYCTVFSYTNGITEHHWLLKFSRSAARKGHNKSNHNCVLSGGGIFSDSHRIKLYICAGEAGIFSYCHRIKLYICAGGAGIFSYCHRIKLYILKRNIVYFLHYVHNTVVFSINIFSALCAQYCIHPHYIIQHYAHNTVVFSINKFACTMCTNCIHRQYIC